MRKIFVLILVLLSFFAFTSCSLSDLFPSNDPQGEVDDSQNGKTTDDNSGSKDGDNGSTNNDNGESQNNNQGTNSGESNNGEGEDNTNQGTTNEGDNGSTSNQNNDNQNDPNGGSNNQNNNTGEEGQNGGSNNQENNNQNQQQNDDEPKEDDLDSDQYYSELFDINNIVEISISISDSELKKINDDYQSDTYRVADKVTIKITKPSGDIIEKTMYEVGIKMKGNTSRTSFFDNGNIYQNVHFKLSFEETFDDEVEYKENERKVWDNKDAKDARKDRTFFGLSKLELKWNREGDGTYSRDIYASKVYQQFGVYAQNTTLGIVTLPNQTFNNEKKALGLYKVYEPIDKAFIKRNFGKNNKDGDLYKASYGNKIGMPNLNNDSKDGYGVDNSLYHNEKEVTYALKTNKKKSTQEDMKNFLSFVGNLNANDSNYEQLVNKYLNVDHFVTFLAIQYLSGDWDNFLYDSNNYYLYFDNNHIAYFIPYDMDRTFGVQAKENDMANKKPTDMYNLQGDWNMSKLLKETIYKDTFIRTKYLSKINEIKDQVLSEENFKTIYDVVYNNYHEFLGDNIRYEDGGQGSSNNAIPSYFTKKKDTLN